MPDDKGGSDLDVFEGLGKKPAASSQQGAPLPEPTPPPGKAPAPRPTERGGYGSPSASGRGLPPPSKVPSRRPQPSGPGVDLPKPKPPPGKAAVSAPAASQPVALPKPKPPPGKASAGGGAEAPSAHVMRNSPSDAPEVEVGTDFHGKVFDEASSPGSILPGGVAADLDWDDEEESTHVFDRADTDLFGDLESRPSRYGDADDTARRNVASAAALLSKSGGTAKPVEIAPPTPQVGFQEIPAPAPVPQEVAVSARSPMGPSLGHAPSLAPPAPTSSRWPLLLAAIAAVALAAAAVFYFRGPSTGEATIHVTQDGKPVDNAKIFVDGQKRCDFSPCVLEGLTPGDKNIRVAAGPASGQQLAHIEAGQKHQIHIALEEGGAAPTAPSDGPASLKVTARQKDVTLFINGVDKGKLPADLTGLEPGKVELKFVGGDAYGVVERTVELEPGKLLDLGQVTLPLAKVKVTFRLETAGARVWLITEEDGKRKERELKFRQRSLIETLDTKQSWTVKAERKGFETFEDKLTFDDDKEEKDFVIELKKEGEPEPVATTTEPGPGPGPAPTETATKPPAASGNGSLTVNSVPPAKAIVDGRPVGSTPKTVSVSPGSHTVVFIKKGYTRKSRTCKVNAGETKVCAARLKKKDD